MTECNCVPDPPFAFWECPVHGALPGWRRVGLDRREQLAKALHHLEVAEAALAGVRDDDQGYWDRMREQLRIMCMDVRREIRELDGLPAPRRIK